MHVISHLSFVILNFLVTGKEILAKEVCSMRDFNSCEDCIKSGPNCAWCKQLNFTKSGEQLAARCGTMAVLQNKGCEETNIISPGSTHEQISNKPLSKSVSPDQEPVQLQPQEVKLRLRPGQPYTFSFKFKRAEDYPVDLYYLMDLSYSMKDDLNNVKSLGKDLLKALQRVTRRAHIGFGSFVDKTVLPFTNTNPKRLKKPCPDIEEHCQPAFGYKHVLSMTDNEQDFNKKVADQWISGNLDTPEGSLDAIMQAAVCGDKIGWRNSTRLLVLTTDAGFHMAGDGKLASIFEPNDAQCHLNKNLIYSKNNEMDYPSVGQVAHKLAENNIQPIFAVTEDVASVYMKLKEIIPKSEVGVLSKDSSNVVSLIESSYKKLSSKVIVSHDELPNHITVMYTSNCGEGEKSDTKGICDNVGIGQELVFNVTVTAAECIEERSFLIGPLGFREKLKVMVETRCKCECDDPQGFHNYCNNSGLLICGTCSCNSNYIGERCECNKMDEHNLRGACRRDNGTECSGLGDCMCGVCQCHKSGDGRAIYGKYCQCDDRSCEVYQGFLCGGKGKCDCGKCVCDKGYEGSACQCKKSTDKCQKVKDTSICNGRGSCICNNCQCEGGYKPPLCEECPGCSSPCQKSASCIECLGFQRGMLRENCSTSCQHIKHKMINKLNNKKACKVKDTENCWMVFVMKELEGFNHYETLIQEDRECTELPNISKIIAGSVAAVVLIGISIAAIIIVIFHIKDLEEYRSFEKERAKTKWLNEENPCFISAQTTVENPLFTGRTSE